MDNYTVQIGDTVAKFMSFEDAKSFAEKESWTTNLVALVRYPDGRTVKVKVGNVP